MDYTMVNRFNWDSDDLITEFHTFQQYTKLLFDGPLEKTKVEKQLTYVFIWVGRPGLKIYNTWTVADADKTLTNYWKRLQETIEPRCNFRLARYNLPKITQEANENIDTFITRIRLHAGKCRFTEAELDDRIIECIIAQGKHSKIHEELLAKDETLTLDKAIQITRMYEATQNDLEQFREKKKIDAFKKEGYGRDKYKKSYKKEYTTTSNAACRYGGRTHSRGKQHCPAADSTCNTCNRKGHWSKVCMSKDKNRTPEKQDYHELQFNAITEVFQDNDEIHTNVILQNTKRPTSIKVKIDSGAQGNILPLRIYKELQKHEMIYPIRDSIVQLTTYDGGILQNRGTILLPIRFGERTTLLHST